MKRRFAALLALTILLACVLPAPAASASGGVCFIALNEKLLDLGTSAFIQDGVVYVPCTVFEYFKIYYTYHYTNSTASLFNTSIQVYFDMVSGTAYDANGNNYEIGAIIRGGVVHVPVGFISYLFGLDCSYIDGGEHGDVCRIKDGNQRMTDSQFIEIAGTLMATYYDSYIRSQNQGKPDDPGKTDEQDNKGCIVYLSFLGLPSDALLETLEKASIRACFLLSPQEIEAAPDRVRQIAGAGHNIGIACGEDLGADYERGAALLFEAARLTTRLVALPVGAELEAYAEQIADKGLALLGCDIDGVLDGLGISNPAVVTARLEDYQTAVNLRILCCDDSDNTLPAVLSFMEKDSYNVKAPDEVTAS